MGKLTRLFFAIIMVGWVFTPSALAVYSVDGVKTGNAGGNPVLLYTFKEGSGNTVNDVSGNGTPLNLTIRDLGRVTWLPGGGIRINQATLIFSQVAATKVRNACQATNEVTVEAWVKPANTTQSGPARIVTMSENISPDRNFTLGQAANRYIHRTRTSQHPGNGETTEGALNSLNTELSHVISSRSSAGVVNIFRDGAQIGTQSVGGNFGNWGNYRIGLGNELDYPAEQRTWLGEIYLVAVYCNAIDVADFQKGYGDGVRVSAPVEPLPNKTVRPAHLRASLIFNRLTGTRIPLDDTRIEQMASLIEAGRPQEAAKIATSDKNFFNITMRYFAAKMSNKDETPLAPFNDFMASVIGVTRDGTDARELLKGNFYYMADTTKATVPSNIVRDLLKSNAHYAALDQGNFNFHGVLKKVQGQVAVNASGAAVAHPDPAGILTSRAFLEAHAIAGTNRRLVEYSMKEFLCAPIEKWSDTSLASLYIGRDVDRRPGGEAFKFQSTCKGCHAGMDSLRRAFGKIDYSHNFVKHSALGFSLYTGDPDKEENLNEIKADGNGIVTKMNHNSDVFPADQYPGESHDTSNTNFTNLLTNSSNQQLLGWRGTLEGSGMGDFGSMLANSKGFSSCMVKRAYKEVCRREPSALEKDMINQITDSFEQGGYQLRDLFEVIATKNGCIGD